MNVTVSVYGLTGFLRLLSQTLVAMGSVFTGYMFQKNRDVIGVDKFIQILPQTNAFHLKFRGFSFSEFCACKLRLGQGIGNKRKSAKWKPVTRSVNGVGSENRTIEEIKRKWSDVRLEIKKRENPWEMDPCVMPTVRYGCARITFIRGPG